MKSVIRGLVLLPFALVFLVFAVANRADVEVVLDPFGLTSTWAKVSMPLFLVMSVAAMLGVIVGGIGSWWSQRGTRDEARRFEREAAELRREIARLRRMSVGLVLDASLEDTRRSQHAPGHVADDPVSRNGMLPVSMIK